MQIDLNQLRRDLGITGGPKTKKVASKRDKPTGKEVDLNKLRDKALKKKK